MKALALVALLALALTGCADTATTRPTATIPIVPPVATPGAAHYLVVRATFAGHDDHEQAVYRPEVAKDLDGYFAAGWRLVTVVVVEESGSGYARTATAAYQDWIFERR